MHCQSVSPVNLGPVSSIWGKPSGSQGGSTTTGFHATISSRDTFLFGYAFLCGIQKALCRPVGVPHMMARCGFHQTPQIRLANLLTVTMAHVNGDMGHDVDGAVLPLQLPVALDAIPSGSNASPTLAMLGILQHSHTQQVSPICTLKALYSYPKVD